MTAVGAARLRVIDPHMHLWDLERLRYPWLEAADEADTFMGDDRSLAVTHNAAAFRAEAEDAGIDLHGAVHIEAGHDPADPLAETRWLQAQAHDPASGGLPQGIVAYADLSHTGVGELLAGHAAYPNVRGIRQILNVHRDPRFDYVGRHFMREPTWQAGFAMLAPLGLSFDLQIYPDQMPEAASLARIHPETQIVLNHTGMFVDRGSVAGWRAWRDGMRALAACPNVEVKISGLGMVDHGWTVESIRPYVLESIDAFGVGRAMFASNFPVDRLYGSYGGVWAAFVETVSGASEAERAALFHDTAARVYRL